MRILRASCISSIICFTFFLFCLNIVYATEISSVPFQSAQIASLQRFPKIKTLDFSDAVFKQYSQEVRENYILLAKNDAIHTNIYTYVATEHETLLTIAARCNIPYETIATINNLAFIDSAILGKTLLLPSSSGLFIAEKASTPLEFLLKTRYSESKGYNIFQLGVNAFTFIPGAKLSPTERAFFTDSSMIPPLEVGVISSSFGMRISPFTGEETFHNGTDIAAPKGTPVFAAKSGIVAFAGVDNIYGNYVIIQHDNNTQSLYAHLDTMLVFSGDISEKGSQIGTVGSTGLSTGDHLHFEIRIGRQAQDPSSIIKNFWQ